MTKANKEVESMTEPGICQERHKRVDERLDTHEKRLNSHSEELDRLSTSDARNTNEITNLCKQIGDLVTTLRWLIGLLVSTLGGFFIWALQSKLF
jgi:chromosome segregation ATPase